VLVHDRVVTSIDATGVPVGLFCVRDYGVKTLSMDPGDVIVFYTDGVTEARNPADEEFGQDRLEQLVASLACEAPQVIVVACVASVTAFRGGARRTDDLTVMAVRRSQQ
jgi:sigma-B regulation protein RsbU (phosphoserine phosphatase)